ncbi:MAG: spermidine synthase [Bryobacteraceae bacterium]
MSRFAFPITIFLGAFLLFQVQPILGKYVLPWFGGGPSVWTTCMLFFQVLLLAGYGYAHLIRSLPSGRAQWMVHAMLLAASLAFVPLQPNEELAARGGLENPSWQILMLLGVSVGLPYLLLASTGPLVQHWVHALGKDRSPYRLYALSNAGSLLALLSYPFLIEPLLPLHLQVSAWSGLYSAFALGITWCAWQARSAEPVPAEEPENGGTIGGSTVLFWFALAACGSVLLLAVTSQMTLEVASVPFLWVLPLAIYLVTFILCFESERWYRRRIFGLATGLSIPAACSIMVAGPAADFRLQLAVYSAVLFSCCMVCHGELSRAKPSPRLLTLYYLVVAAGGAAGGAFVALGAPRMFQDFSEFPISLIAACVLGLIGWMRERAWRGYGLRAVAPLAGLAMGIFGAATSFSSVRDPDVFLTVRNFYGVLQLSYKSDDNGVKRLLTHGRVAHGFQYMSRDKLLWPTSYYGRKTAIGITMEQHPARANGDPLRVGVVGLGTGTLAAYGREGDVFRFYEINPEVIRLAQEQFHYLALSPARVEVVPGDARVRMEREEPQGFDVLVVDAFSSDSIPTHLLTAECAEVYRKHLKPNGALLIHISNRALDLSPVVLGMTARLGWEAVRMDTRADPEAGTNGAQWMVVTGNRALLENQQIREGKMALRRKPVDWTDDFSSLWQVLKF